MRIASEMLLAVLNSLWQAALVTALVWAAFRFARWGFLNRGFLKEMNAATRYAIWWAVLGVVLALPAAPRMVAWWHARAPAPQAVPANQTAPPRAALPLIEDPPAMVTLRGESSAKWPLWIAGLWAALCVYRLWQIGRSYFYLRGVKRRARIAPETVARPLPDASRATRVLLSEDVASPMAVGFLHPAVILPEGLPEELAQAEMEHVLLHEAAHIARRDDWSNLLAKTLGAALALHPVAWWILRQIEREREIACDDWVVARVGSARPYAESLARMSELRWARQAKAHGAAQGEALASGMFGGGSHLGQRIEMLLGCGREFSPRASRASVTVGGVALLACVVAGAIAPRMIAFAQSERPAFVVAAIRANEFVPPGHPQMSCTGGRFVWMDSPMKGAVEWAYDLEYFQISDVPDWFDSFQHTYNIEAKAVGPVSEHQCKLMVRALFEDRFKLKVHHETRPLPVWALTVARGGPKLREATAEAGVRLNGRQVQTPPGADPLRGWSMQQLASALTGTPSLLGRPVVDQTGLKGIYQIELDYSPLPGGDRELRDAVRELGLKLDETKAPLDYLVIDHVEKPDAN